LNTYYKCNLSAITHKRNISGHVLIWTFFLVLVCGTCAQSLFTTNSSTLYILSNQLPPHPIMSPQLLHICAGAEFLVGIHWTPRYCMCQQVLGHLFYYRVVQVKTSTSNCGYATMLQFNAPFELYCVKRGVQTPWESCPHAHRYLFRKSTDSDKI
jgi:hypothetical protein